MALNAPPPITDLPLPNTYWVIPSRLLAGEFPGGKDFSDSRARLARLQAAGMDYFIDLTEETELPAYRHLLPFRVKYQRAAIADQSVPRQAAQTRSVLADIRKALSQGRGVYVHCRAGIGRTGLIIGCFLAEEQSDGKQALKSLNRLWSQSARSASWPSVPQTPEQADYIRHWPKLAKQAG